MSAKNPITVAHGDGIGPEIMNATLSILEAAGAGLDIETIEVGERVYKAGYTAGIGPEAWDSIRRTKTLLKAPITTPQGGGYKSLNVTIRKTLSLFANVRPSASYSPFINTKHPLMDVVIIRENEEGLYAGIEHRQTDEVYQTLKLISRPGSERIIRYAFEYARRNNRHKVSCFSKDNIMKLTDGIFHQVFNEIAAEYPDIENEHYIIDIGTARVADHPEQFDVIVLGNLYGDILSDVTSQLTGSVGLGASANIGEDIAMFEAIHGSAPDIVGQDIANPSGLLLAAVMMLNHLGQMEIAERIHNAWLRTIEDGVHTADIFNRNTTQRPVGTKAFSEAVIARLGKYPNRLPKVSYGQQSSRMKHIQFVRPTPQKNKQLVGVDMFLDWDEADRDPNVLGERLCEQTNGEGLELTMITNRGLKVWPEGLPETFCTDHWRCRYTAPGGSGITHEQIVKLLARTAQAGLDFIKTEGLYTFDGEPGYSLGQGE
ncbi:MAG: NADP-dependent isocitrate dehydrogenase [Anaerolineales bacterium]